ncbi:MAG TPA: ABC transporter permease [bacterium]|nr:ABC transporter permease [bacterium]
MKAHFAVGRDSAATSIGSQSQALPATPRVVRGGGDQPVRGLRHAAGRLRRNPLALASLAFLILAYGSAVLAAYIAPHSPTKMDLGAFLAPPGPGHVLGTDESGRDVLSRLMFGGRVSLAVGLAAVVVSVVVGVAVGLTTSYFAGWLDIALMRLTDAMLTIPTFFLLLVVMAFFGSSLQNVVLAIGLTSWMGVARLVRGEILRVKASDFVEAARAMGASPRRMMMKHLLPQAGSQIIVAASLGTGGAILAESALSYLGLGVQPPTPSWGNMLSGAQNYIWQAPQLAVYPGALILLTVLAFNFLGEGFRDVFSVKD